MNSGSQFSVQLVHPSIYHGGESKCQELKAAGYTAFIHEQKAEVNTQVLSSLAVTQGPAQRMVSLMSGMGAPVSINTTKTLPTGMAGV